MYECTQFIWRVSVCSSFSAFLTLQMFSCVYPCVAARCFYDKYSECKTQRSSVLLECSPELSVKAVSLCTSLQVYEHQDGSKSLKLGDFGLATIVDGPLYTVCGTPTYVAPEIIAETG